MNREDIIRMAREATKEAPREDWNSTAWVFGDETLEAFAALVASAEHKRVQQVYTDAATDSVKAAIAYEREACAKMVEDSWMAFSRAPNVRLDITPFPELSYVAKAIRARGQA